ncbi:dual specificity protein phosphatase 19 [Anaeramoeba flamelloides]|uniref:Dual specificity protein phosphatase 19 n=1 Tax=Anaeramoeba flamelloides TaxID=1746091 RepID=A0ABQ8Y7H2_9EUKA|nr:dual specificity protein phosphatase 19 [Anaeramoeba flamelloides]
MNNRSISEIEERLFLGTVDSSKDLGLLKEKKISHILNISQHCNNFPKRFEYLQLYHLDTDGDFILTKFPLICDFIGNCLTNGGVVLVHCTAGISRSGTAVLCYIMKKYGYDFENALIYVREKRYVQPNTSFKWQLRVWFNFQYDLEKKVDHEKSLLIKKMQILSTAFHTLYGKPEVGWDAKDPELKKFIKTMKVLSQQEIWLSIQQSQKLIEHAKAKDPKIVNLSKRYVMYKFVPSFNSWNFEENDQFVEEFVSPLKKILKKISKTKALQKNL